ncbi:MAG: hypothetical protein H6718_27220 [Polyangiaceae bacterium]|nr:hypothetical protein [Myxococcales bacterium]MCB9589135.1 hypothetical protein [Polyangiaceae bacterium]
MTPRKQGIRALAAGLFCWVVNTVLALTLGMYGPILIVLGAFGVFAGVALLIGGKSLPELPAAQRLPVFLIALLMTASAAFALLHVARRLSGH